MLLQEKMNILKRLDSDENMRKIARDFKLGHFTVYDIKKKSKITECVKTMA